VCLQMGHSWLWCRSETESPSDSEKNSDFQSVLSWDSSLDLELGSWRNTEEAALGKLEESSQEADYRLKFSDPLWEDDSEDYPKAERQCEDESLLQGKSSAWPGRRQGRTPPGKRGRGEVVLGEPLVRDESTSPHCGVVFGPLLQKQTEIFLCACPCRYSGPFLKAVSEKQAPGYRDVVKRPMDLTSIKRNLSKGHIQSMAQFQCSLMLMFQNAVMYNSCNHHVHRMALEMQREVLEQMQMAGSHWLGRWAG
uniref:Bromo domain-containing protein n=1 Tax=Anas platyrhynchos TaxID=8839 RepID=A0A8B9SKW4_ANAPL